MLVLKISSEVAAQQAWDVSKARKLLPDLSSCDVIGLASS